MPKYLFLLSSLILLFSFNSTSNAQAKVSASDDSNIVVTASKKTVVIGGKVALFVAKETAKAGWETTKFAAKEIAAPLAKSLVLKAAPKATVFLVKRGTPIATKIIVTYLKL